VRDFLSLSMVEDAIIMYTDGAARWNPGPGGYGTVLMYKGHRKELAGGFKKTTNNRMELLAVIIGLEALTRKDLKIKIYSDSKYVVDAVEKGWLWNWQKQNFKKKKNPDLWKRYIQVQKGLSIDFHWVKGHANIPENERCDELAVEASHQQNLPVDKGYEQD
jgi:ribonuclease HI